MKNIYVVTISFNKFNSNNHDTHVCLCIEIVLGTWTTSVGSSECENVALCEGATICATVCFCCRTCPYIKQGLIMFHMKSNEEIKMEKRMMFGTSMKKLWNGSIP